MAKEDVLVDYRCDLKSEKCETLMVQSCKVFKLWLLDEQRTNWMQDKYHALPCRQSLTWMLRKMRETLMVQSSKVFKLWLLDEQRTNWKQDKYRALPCSQSCCSLTWKCNTKSCEKCETLMVQSSKVFKLWLLDEQRTNWKQDKYRALPCSQSCCLRRCVRR